jgi:hypothetical protein
MKSYPIARACWRLANILLVVSLGLVVYSAGWEFSTRSYLKGFADAIIPASDSPEQKAEAILAWMQHGSARRDTLDTDALAARNPENTLNYRKLLEVCGTATNAFVNLAQSSGLPARRLLLLDQNNQSKHVVAEILLDDRWIVVDPAYRVMLRLPTGRLAGRAELQNPEILRAATREIPGYPSSYTYESAVHIRLSRIPLVGRYLRRVLIFLWPSWEEAINWTLLLERQSFAAMTISILLLCFALAMRLLLGWYFSSKAGMVRVRLRDQLFRAGNVLIRNSK